MKPRLLIIPFCILTLLSCKRPEEKKAEYPTQKQDLADSLLFKTVSIDSAGIVSWTLDNTDETCQFEIEELRWNKWETIKSIKNNGTINYSTQLDTACGIYTIRVRTALNNGSFSESVLFPSKTIQKDRACKVNEFRFTHNTLYEIYNLAGEKVKSGCNDTININDLDTGTYFVNYANMTEEIILK